MEAHHIIALFLSCFFSFVIFASFFALFHVLSAMIYKLDIVPTEFMEAEIARRLESWVLDTDGRRELLSKINFELKKWQHDHKQLPYDRLPADEQRKIRAGIRTKLISKQKRLIEALEEIHPDRTGDDKGAAISKDLFWKYDAYCKQTRSPDPKKKIEPKNFGDWLTLYGEKHARKIDGFKQNLELRKLVSGVRTERRHSVAALNEIDREISAAADSLSNVAHRVELKKSLIALKRSVADAKIAGTGDGLIVSKEDFDRHLESVLAPRMRDLNGAPCIAIIDTIPAIVTDNSHPQTSPL